MLQKTEHVDQNAAEFEIDNLDLITHLFFAYRDFTSDPDRHLNKIGFGRAHHRVLFFVGRKPGMAVADLLTILGITKQSLARVLKDLLEAAFIEQQIGKNDKRTRLLYLTKKGREFLLMLSQEQSSRIENALQDVTPEGRAGIVSFLEKMLDEEGKEALAQLEQRHPHP